VEQSVKQGNQYFNRGYQVPSTPGILYVDEINLLDDNINQLLNVLSEGRNQIEGISFQHPVNLCSLLPINPEEGHCGNTCWIGLRSHFSADAQLGSDERVQAVDQAIGYAASPQVFLNQYSED